jgi:putative tryptophan/tyrosine transport system substrate-binding protein
LRVGQPMKRRDFLSLVGGAAAAWPIVVSAQFEVMRRVGILMNGSQADPGQATRLAAFRESLEKLGWVEDRNVRFDVRFAVGSDEAAQVLAQELVALRPAVIFATATGVTTAVQRQTGTIPIVFTNVSDPVGSGFVTNLARPNSNLTGFMLFEASIAGKWLSMLKEINPELTRAAFVGNPATTAFDHFLRGAQAVAPALSVELLASRVATAADILHTIEASGTMPKDGLVFPPDAFTDVNRDLIITLAARHRLPAVYGTREFASAGGLMAYDTDRVDLFRRAATYVNNVLRGANPGELPVQAPTKYETIVNLKTARALGLDVPPTLLVRADEVIE